MKMNEESVSDSNPPISLWDWFKLESHEIKILTIYGTAVGIVSLIVPISVQTLVNTIAFGSLLQPILVLALIVLGFLILSGMLRMAELQTQERIQIRLFVRTALQLATRLSDISINTLQTNKVTTLINRFLEISLIQKSYSYLLLEGISLALRLVISLLLLSLYHPLLLGYSLLLVTAVALVILIPARSGMASAKKESNRKYEVAELLEEVVENHLIYRSDRLTGFLESRADSLASLYVDSRKDHFAILRSQYLATFMVQALFSALLLAAGGWLVVKGQLSLGQLVAAEIIVSSLLYSLTKVGSISEKFYDLTASVAKIQKLMTLEREKSGFQKLQSTLRQQKKPASIDIENLEHFAGERHLFKQLNLKVASGEAIAFTGENGTGKSTLIELLYGLRSADSGIIKIDSQPLRELDISDVRTDVVLVQGVQLISGSVIENLVLQRKDLPIEEVRSLINEFGLESAISGLPEGLNTYINATNPPFSKGQLQRLMLVRALLSDPRLLLLDEALDSLDPDSKTATIDAIFARRNRFTLIVATHSTQLGGRCDRSFKIQEGNLKPV
jgi:putative ABC transport system ATP-binding protein